MRMRSHAKHASGRPSPLCAGALPATACHDVPVPVPARRGEYGVLGRRGGGGGAPLMGADGKVRADLKEMHYHPQGEEGSKAPGGGRGGGVALSPPVAAPAHAAAEAGGGARVAAGKRGGEGDAEGGAGEPSLRFRTDNAYMTKDELSKKQRQQVEMQEALRVQIEEKKRREEEAKAREKAEEAREIARLER